MNDSYQDPSSGFHTSGPDSAESSSGTDHSYRDRSSGPGGAPVMDNPYAREKMAVAALFLAVAAIITFQVFFISMPLGISAVILALLSRGEGSMVRRARAALCIGAIAASLSAAITGYSVYSVMTDPALRREFEKLYVYYTGQEFPFPSESGSGFSSGSPDASLSEDPQTLIQDILSGNYRKKNDSLKEAADSGSSADSSIDGLLNNSAGGSSVSGKGGNYI